MRVFITGATGFVGAGLAVQALRDGHTVYALVRGGDRNRVEMALDATDPGGRWKAGMLHAVAGDVTLEGLGLTQEWRQSLSGAIDLVLHAAGQTRFETEDGSNDETNHRGTLNVVNLFAEFGCGRFFYISTAYVCGRRTGWIPEEPILEYQPHNGYETSKILAELKVRERFPKATIVRPSIVVAALGQDWEGSRPVTYAGYYGYFRPFYLLWKWKNDQGILDLKNRRVPGDPGAEINLVPLDNVVDMVFALAEKPESQGGTFHAVNPEGPTYDPLVRQTFAAMGIQNFRIVNNTDPDGTRDLDKLELQIRSGINPFRPYIAEDRRFQTNQIGQFYDLERVPRINERQVGSLIGDAIRHEFKDVDRRKVR